VGIEQLEAHPECAFVSGRCNNIAADGSPLKDPPRLHVEGDHYLALLRRCYIWPPAVVMFRRAALEAVGGFDTSLRAAEDYEMYLRLARRFPVCNHKGAIAEYRRHDASATWDHALMLSTSVGVLRSQREHVRRQKHYEEAYKAGIKWEQGKFGDPLVEEVKAQVKEGKWRRALRGVLVLLRYYPQGLALLSERRMLARRLQVSKQRLEVRERHLKELEGGAREEVSEDALAEERQKVQRLRKRIPRLEQRIRKLDLRSQNGLKGKVRTWFERFGRVRGKASSRSVTSKPAKPE
jgi:hypothetical protein